MNPIALKFKHAADSSRALFWLNLGLWFKLPFNRPHGIRLLSTKTGFSAAYLPFRKRNRNHLNTMHACALATLAEFAAGTCLLSIPWPFSFRIVMKSMQVDYHLRVSSPCTASCSLEETSWKAWFLTFETGNDKILLNLTTEVFNSAKELVATSRTEWQIKKVNH